MFEVSDISTLFDSLAQKLSTEFGSVWFYYQLAIIIVLLLISRAAGDAMSRRVRVGERTMGWPLALRVAARAAILNIGTALLVVLLALTRFVMVSLTWPSRSYLIGVALSLASVWLLIRIIAGTVRSTFVVRAAALIAWVTVALHIVGFLEPTLDILDSVALTVGKVRLSPLLVIKAALLLALMLWIANVLSNFVQMRTDRIGDLTPSARVLLNKLLRLAIFVLAVLIAMSAVGIDLSVLAFFSGAIGLGLGFGLQKVVGNFVSGIILLADKSIKPGDLITIGDNFGRVSTMTTRYTSLAAPDGREFLIPNESLITQQVTNWTYNDTRTALNVAFGTSYAADPRIVRDLAIATLSKVPRVLSSKPPVCLLTAFAESSINFSVYFWIEDPERGLGNIRSDVMFALWYAFKEAGIDIPHTFHDPPPPPPSAPPQDKPAREDTASSGAETEGETPAREAERPDEDDGAPRRS